MIVELFFALLITWIIGHISPVYMFMMPLSTLFFLAHIAYAKTKSRKEAIDQIGLTASEQAALKRSVDEVERFFANKQAEEAFQEALRVMLLEDRQIRAEAVKIGHGA